MSATTAAAPRSLSPGKQRKRTPGSIVANILVILVLVVFMFPIVMIFLTSIKNRVDALASPPVWIFTPTFSNYVDIFQQYPFSSYLRNSVLVATLNTLIALIIGVPAAYALARFRFRGSNHVQFWVLSQRMMPAIAAVIPLFILFRRFGLTNSIAGLILIYLTSSLPFIVFMLTRFFEEIPRELEEASLVEGSSWFGAMTRIAIPLARPGIAATAIFTFIFSWNEFLFALILTSTERAQTMPVAVTLFIRETGIEWGYMTAVAVIMMIPTALLTLAAQRHLVQGLTMGALK
ncbi:MAG: carbohydrate ABC transporter permease [Thermomicrobiales bacterium]|nr:carbohydrate ABC transporter permease [Thermomicrobiales bacterium]